MPAYQSAQQYDVKTKYPVVLPGTKPPPGYFSVQPWGILPIKPPHEPVGYTDSGTAIYAVPATNMMYSQQ